MTSGANFIDDPRKWRISKSGFSIRTGWYDDKRIVAQYSGPRSPMDSAAFRQWYEAAEQICDLYNSTLLPETIAQSASWAESEYYVAHPERDNRGACNFQGRGGRQCIRPKGHSGFHDDEPDTVTDMLQLRKELDPDAPDAVVISDESGGGRNGTM